MNYSAPTWLFDWIYYPDGSLPIKGDKCVCNCCGSIDSFEKDRFFRLRNTKTKQSNTMNRCEYCAAFTLFRNQIILFKVSIDEL